MNFERVNMLGMTAYAAKSGRWQFLILQDLGRWSASYRLIEPKGNVSASSTMRGPFDALDDATAAAEDMLRELKALS